mmetsp:Transcript_11535/g.35279  ORF Transcript_11535/g.35279 Transcript_11535/m.35279 type:complete len:536 (+) Transcript_11535:3490-5097(+)
MLCSHFVYTIQHLDCLANLRQKRNVHVGRHQRLGTTINTVDQQTMELFGIGVRATVGEHVEESAQRLDPGQRLCLAEQQQREQLLSKWLGIGHSDSRTGRALRRAPLEGRRIHGEERLVVHEQPVDRNGELLLAQTRVRYVHRAVGKGEYGRTAGRKDHFGGEGRERIEQAIERLEAFAPHSGTCDEPLRQLLCAALLGEIGGTLHKQTQPEVNVPVQQGGDARDGRRVGIRAEVTGQVERHTGRVPTCRRTLMGAEPRVREVGAVSGTQTQQIAGIHRGYALPHRAHPIPQLAGTTSGAQRPQKNQSGELVQAHLLGAQRQRRSRGFGPHPRARIQRFGQRAHVREPLGKWRGVGPLHSARGEHIQPESDASAPQRSRTTLERECHHTAHRIRIASGVTARSQLGQQLAQRITHTAERRRAIQHQRKSFCWAGIRVVVSLQRRARVGEHRERHIGSATLGGVTEGAYQSTHSVGARCCATNTCQQLSEGTFGGCAESALAAAAAAEILRSHAILLHLLGHLFRGHVRALFRPAW